MRSLIRSSIVALSIFAFPVFAVAATTVPNTFTAGTPAKAADINANFQALATAINTLSARLDKLDGTTQVTAADLAGTYKVTGIGTQFNVLGDSVYNSAMSLGGTITLAADGTGTANMSAQGIQMVFPVAGGTTSISTPPPNNTTTSFTWSLSGVVIIPGGLLLSVRSPGIVEFLVLTRI